MTLVTLLSVLPPVFAQEGEVKLLPGDGAAGDFFGRFVAISDTTAIIAATADGHGSSQSGSAYLFEIMTGNEIARLTPSDGAPGERFGSSVAISGSTAIVGAYSDGDNGSDSGSAYLFDTTAGGEIVKLLPADGATGDYFGVSVAINETTTIVGASGDDDSGLASGSVYLFDTTTGAQIAKLLAGDGTGGERFGASVALSGTTAIVGAPGDDDSGVDAGSAYLFDTTTGAQVAKLLASDGEGGERFGSSVAISGTTAIVGAYDDDDNGSSSGSAYLFDTTTGGQIAKLMPADGAAFDYFGASVAISGRTAIIGAYGDGDNGSASGSAYLFDATTGAQVAKLLPGDGAAGDLFGWSVAINGTEAIAGAYGDDDIDTDAGSAYVYTYDCNGNGTVDSEDILDGTSSDCNGNSIPDECEIAASPELDLNQNGIVDSCECNVESYCISAPNSVGSGAVMGVTGSASVSANDLELLADSVPPGQFGVFFYGPVQQLAALGDGFRCVGTGGAGLYRFPPVSSGSAGVASYAVDNASPPGASAQITDGSTWNFQFWYRDPMGGPAGFNLSDAVEITFCP